MRHLVNGKLILAFTIAFENAANPRLRSPEIEQNERVFAEQPRHVPVAVFGDQGIVGLPAYADELLQRWPGAVGEVGDPDFARIIEAEDKAIAAGVLQADHFRARSVAGDGRDLRDLLQRIRIEDVHAARLVISDRDQHPILGDGAADAVAGLDDATEPTFLAADRLC